MSKELLEAATRLLDGGMGAIDRPEWVAKSVMAMARHILATVYADDDEPITDAWWRTLSKAWFASLDDEERLCLVVHDEPDEDPDNRCLIVLSDYGSWGFWEQCRQTLELHSPHHGTYRRIKTRGDVRRLCAGLGIELVETLPHRP